MYSTCLHCNHDLGRNEVLEWLPVGRRVAFDAGQGRLWVVCRRCAKWNLVPFDTRLETIDACERLYRDTATRYATDNIGLARVREGLELVRIGEPLRPEFAAWRYGESFGRRRRRNLVIGSAGVLTAGLAIGGAAAAGVGGAFLLHGGVQSIWEMAVKRRMRLQAIDPQHDVPIRWRIEELRQAGLFWPEGAAPRLTIPRPFSWGRLGPRADWEGADLQAVGRRVLGRLNWFAGRRGEIDAAAELLGGERGDLTGWLRARAGVQRRELAGKGVLTGGSTPYYSWELRDRPLLLLQRLPTTERLAVEMWMSEDIERIWLAGELKLLEREWRQAEALAKISDDLALEAAGGVPAG